ncbi:hypothetical protein MMC08_003301 [Hypocenomyce scalaris]|nr:hypothetical protein [Hypocenomyce scalaris]
MTRPTKNLTEVRQQLNTILNEQANSRIEATHFGPSLGTEDNNLLLRAQQGDAAKMVSLIEQEREVRNQKKLAEAMAEKGDGSENASQMKSGVAL